MISNRKLVPVFLDWSLWPPKYDSTILCVMYG
uniref:Uncharacterized protein n=1 Tax=Rhizophora mucronata TaxID=61149 RepID=A0A2P2LIG9_RHIMU